MSAETLSPIGPTGKPHPDSPYPRSPRCLTPYPHQVFFSDTHSPNPRDRLFSRSRDRAGLATVSLRRAGQWNEETTTTTSMVMPITPRPRPVSGIGRQQITPKVTPCSSFLPLSLRMSTLRSPTDHQPKLSLSPVRRLVSRPVIKVVAESKSSSRRLHRPEPMIVPRLSLSPGSLHSCTPKLSSKHSSPSRDAGSSVSVSALLSIPTSRLSMSKSEREGEDKVNGGNGEEIHPGTDNESATLPICPHPSGGRTALPFTSKRVGRKRSEAVHGMPKYGNGGLALDRIPANQVSMLGADKSAGLG
ncbi:hypothetical protein IAR55_000082 [Kwoniella newhampshirensis]|uniref:Uncharacterized protein n=1 Tax=Kwoniella newhampshirensis TaxID=1651941 RepID=A0AAW0Z5V5_9TREE